LKIDDWLLAEFSADALDDAGSGGLGISTEFTEFFGVAESGIEHFSFEEEDSLPRLLLELVFEEAGLFF
jgi:hypothetical protein